MVHNRCTLNAGHPSMKQGFSPVGIEHNVGYKLGAWHDLLHMEKALRDHDGPPGPLRTIGMAASEYVRLKGGNWPISL